jgi:hypothetical protein
LPLKPALWETIMAIKTKVPGASWLKSLFGRKERNPGFAWDVNVLSDSEAEEKQREDERRRKRSRAHAVSAKLAELGCLTAVFLTADMVQKGLYKELVRFYGESLPYWLMSVSVAFGLSLCIYIGFLMASKLSTTMERTSSYIAGWVCIFFFCLWAVGTSSWYAFMSTTGIPALEMQLNAAVDKLEKSVDQATHQIKNARGMPTAMASKAAGFMVRGDSEAKGGGATGARGAGPVSQSLEGAAAVLNTGAAEIRAAIDKADQDALKMREKLRDISAIVNKREMSIFEREAAFMAGASELRSLIGAMNSAGLGEMVRSTLAAVESAVSVMPTDGSKVGARQEAAIEQTRADMETIAAALRKILDDLQGSQALSGSLVETASLSQVVWDHKHNFKPALALAIGIDLFAVWALIFLGIHGLEKVRRSEVRPAAAVPAIAVPGPVKKKKARA